LDNLQMLIQMIKQDKESQKTKKRGGMEIDEDSLEEEKEVIDVYKRKKVNQELEQIVEPSDDIEENLRIISQRNSNQYGNEVYPQQIKRKKPKTQRKKKGDFPNESYDPTGDN